MAKKAGKSGTDAVRYGNPYNETNNPDPNSPDMTGTDIYFGGYDEVLKMHLDDCTIVSTPNSRSGEDILGKPAPGEVQVMSPPVKQLSSRK